MRSSGDSAWHHQQGLPAGVQPSPPGSDLTAALTQHVGEHDQCAVGHGHPGGVGQRSKLLVGRVDLGNHPSTAGALPIRDAHTPTHANEPVDQAGRGSVLVGPGIAGANKAEDLFDFLARFSAHGIRQC